MTVSAQRVDPRSQDVKVQFTYGPLQASCTENRSHLRSFHTDLGRLLDQMEAESAEGKE